MSRTKKKRNLKISLVILKRPQLGLKRDTQSNFAGGRETCGNPSQFKHCRCEMRFDVHAYTGRRLFQRVILLSGSSVSPWAVSRDSVAQSTALAERLNCSTAVTSRAQLGPAGTPDQALVVQCLRRVDVKRLLEAARGVGSARSDEVWTAPRFGPTLGTGTGAGVLSGSSVQQLVYEACDNRLSSATNNNYYTNNNNNNISVAIQRINDHPD